MIKHLLALRAHGEWADARLLHRVRAAPQDVSDVVRELAHVRAAQDIWLSRIEQRAATLPVWPELSIQQLADTGAVVDSALRTYFESLHPVMLEHLVEYANSTGDAFQAPLGEVLLHMLTHGQYHRGKANAELRRVGARPAGVDYIMWQRQQQAM